MTSTNEFNLISKDTIAEINSRVPLSSESTAYLAALNAVNLILLNAVAFQQNNSMIYTTALGLALKKIADGDEHGAQLLEAIQKNASFDQDYLAKSGKICAEILIEFKKLT